MRERSPDAIIGGQPTPPTMAGWLDRPSRSGKRDVRQRCRAPLTVQQLQVLTPLDPISSET